MTKLLDYTYLYREGTGVRTLLLLHGTGGDERDLLPIATQLDPTAHILSVRGNVLENGMNRYFKRFADGSLDRDDLSKRTASLIAFIEAVAHEHSIDIKKTVGVGFSNGANILLNIICSTPNLLHAALLLRPMTAALPDTVSPLGGLPVYIGSGTKDAMIPVGDASRIDTVLRAAGARTTLRITQNGHGLGSDDIELSRAWLAALS